MADIKAVHVLVKGRVQGIGYRWFVENTASNLGLTGWVRNLPDGNVEAEAEGAKADLESFISALETGHPGARVKEIKTDWADIAERLTDGFEIRY